MRNAAVTGTIHEALSGCVYAKITSIIHRKDSPIELPNLCLLAFSAGVVLFVPHMQAGSCELIAEDTVATGVCKGFVSRSVTL